jgi:CRP/FNR family transcriptional regulator, cyclic AMP receptor protein
VSQSSRLQPRLRLLPTGAFCILRLLMESGPLGDTDPLAGIPLFLGLEPSVRERVARRLEERTLGDGELLFREGDPGGTLCVVLEGELVIVTISKGREQVLSRVGPGGHVGEMSVIDGAPRSATARAVGLTRIAELSREDVLDDLVASPSAAQAMLGEMAQRLRRATALIGEHSARNAVRELEERASLGERLADKIAMANGSWFFIVGLLVTTGIWMGINMILGAPPDPYPFILFNLLLGITAAIQGPLIMMSQNRQANKDRAQAAADYDVNLKNELGIQALQRDVARLERKVDELGPRPPA